MIDKLFDLTGKSAVVTCGSRGLGKKMADAFASAGASVAIVSRKIDACQTAAVEISERHGVETWAFGCNVSSWDDCTELSRLLIEQVGQVDVLVNNAGLSPLHGSLTDISESLYGKVFGVNLKGPFRLSTLIGEHMAAGPGGSIINISSTESVFPSVNAVPYGAAKAGLNALTSSLARSYGPTVRVNTIMPGPFLTDISAAWDMPEIQRSLDRSLVMRRAGEPSEIIGAAIDLASNASSYTTGSTIRVDGGTFAAP